jgi:signal transduction histidine kinase
VGGEQRLAASQLAAREDERKRLAHELHDELGAHLTAFRYALARLEPWLALDQQSCASVFQATQQAFEALCAASGRITEDLRAPASGTSLVKSLDQWIAHFQTCTDLSVSLVCVADPRLTQLRQDACTALFRIAQEAVNNAAKHAASPRVDVHISAGPTHLQLCVTDYGRGFNPAARPRHGHFGISGMRERCKALGGTLKISSQPAHTTRVIARLPWHAILRGESPGSLGSGA